MLGVLVYILNIGFISVALQFITPVNDEVFRKGEIPGNSRILAFILDVKSLFSDLSSWQVDP